MLPTKQDALDNSKPRSAMRAGDQSAADLRTIRFVRRESAKTRQRASSASDDDGEDDGDDTIVIEAQPKRVSAGRLERHPRALSRSTSPPPTIVRRSASIDATIGESAASAASGTIATQPPSADVGARRRPSRTFVAAAPDGAAADAPHVGAWNRRKATLLCNFLFVLNALLCIAIIILLLTSRSNDTPRFAQFKSSSFCDLRIAQRSISLSFSGSTTPAASTSTLSTTPSTSLRG